MASCRGQGSDTSTGAVANLSQGRDQGQDHDLEAAAAIVSAISAKHVCLVIDVCLKGQS